MCIVKTRLCAVRGMSGSRLTEQTQQARPWPRQLRALLELCACHSEGQGHQALHCAQHGRGRRCARHQRCERVRWCVFSANAPLTLQSMCFRSCTSRSRTVCRALSTPTLCVCARAPTAASARRRACASAVTPASRTRLLPRLVAGTVPNRSVSKPDGMRSAVPHSTP